MYLSTYLGLSASSPRCFGLRSYGKSACRLLLCVVVFASVLVDGGNDGAMHTLGVLNLVYFVRGATASYQFDATRADDSLPEGLIEVCRLYLVEGYLRHLDVQDAVFLDEACVGDGKFLARAYQAGKHVNEDGDEQHAQSCVKHPVVVMLVVEEEGKCCKQDAYEACYQIGENGEPVEAALQYDGFAIFKTFLNVICHVFFVYGLGA